MPDENQALIQEALQRRAGQDQPQDQAMPQEQPQPQPQPAPQPQPQPQPQGGGTGEKPVDILGLANSAVKALMGINNPNFDQETRQMSKMLMLKAIKDYT